MSSFTENSFMMPAPTRKQAGETIFILPPPARRLILSSSAGPRSGDSISVYLSFDNAPAWASARNFLPGKNDRSDWRRKYAPSPSRTPLDNFPRISEDSRFVKRALSTATMEPCLTINRSMMILEIYGTDRVAPVITATNSRESASCFL